MNEKLAAFYRSFFDGLIHDLTPFPEVSEPLLCHVPDTYASTPIRLMIVGQQTRGWGPDSGEANVSTLMQLYQDFDLASTYRHRSSPFWTAAHELGNAVNPSGPERAFIWSNLVKVDEDGDRPQPQVEELVAKYSILPGEIAVTRPDAIVFFTGPYYNDRLRMTFPNAQLEPLAAAVTKVRHPDLPERSFQTYHPNYLQRSSQWDTVAALAQFIRGADPA